MNEKHHQNQKWLSNISDLVKTKVTPLPFDFTRQPVKVKLNGIVMATYSTELFRALQSIVDLNGGVLRVTEAQLSAYVRSLVRLRVDYVNGVRVGIRPTDYIVVPSFIHVVLENLGLARDENLGIELYPELDMEDSGVLLSDEEMLEISNHLRSFGAVGFEYADGYSRDKTGSWDFMAMTIISNIVRTHTHESHPVYSLLASTLELSGVELVLQPRVSYGRTQHLASIVRALVGVRNGYQR